MFRCALVGVSGSRARGHADAFARITRGGLVAVSSRNEKACEAFARTRGIEAWFTDHREMFGKARPDVVLINTPPSVRASILRDADEAGVPGVIIEKPIAMQGEDWRELSALAPTLKTRVAVNHQLHFHPRRRELAERVRAGELGPLRFAEASAGCNAAVQGTHMLQALGDFLGERPVRAVIGQVAGDKALAPTPRAHVAPDNTLLRLIHEDGLHADLLAGELAPRVAGHEPVWAHKRIAVYGERGACEWTMWGWRLLRDGQPALAGEHDYAEQDILGQARMTEAMFDWLEDERAVHPLRLERALAEYACILAGWVSGLEHRPVSLPFDPLDGLHDRLRERLRNQPPS